MHSDKLWPAVALRRAGIVASLAALFAIIADLTLQYTPNASHLLSAQDLYFLDVPPTRLFIGHYLGVSAILLEIVGFWQIYQALQPAGERWALPFFLISAYGAMLGAAFHGTAIFIAFTVQAQNRVGAAMGQPFASLLASFDTARAGLAIPALLGIVVSSCWYAFVVGCKASLYPRWMAICNPLVFLLLIAALAFGIRPLALVLAPTALNLSHLLFFISSTVVLWKTPKT